MKDMKSRSKWEEKEMETCKYEDVLRVKDKQIRDKKYIVDTLTSRFRLFLTENKEVNLLMFFNKNKNISFTKYCSVYEGFQRLTSIEYFQTS